MLFILLVIVGASICGCGGKG
ncbi:YjcZ family sporulation protein [Peribacillus phoenicis]